MTYKIESASEFLRSMVAKHKPVAVLVGVSGGYDSLVTAHLTLTAIPGAECFHINTGIGIERTRQFVRDTCKDRGWPLTEVMPEDHSGMTYREMVLKHGFPGPGSHSFMYRNLKERGIRYLVREKKRGHSRNSRVLIVTGVRSDESSRRRINVGREQKIGAQIWVAPIMDFTAGDKMRYVKNHSLPRNPVADTLGMSGECLCGAFAHKGEKSLVRLVCPQTANQIDALEKEVASRGWPWPWEGKPTAAAIREKHGQGSLFRPMCVGCEKTEDERFKRELLG